MKRRTFIGLLGTAAAAAPFAARAQQGKLSTIGVLAGITPNPAPLLQAMRDGLRDLGYVEGGNLRLEVRVVESKLLDEKAAELVALKVDIIVGFFTPAPVAAKKTTSAIPIVMVSGDPVGTGLVASLARPGGNVTGLSSGGAEIAGKTVDIFREIVPSTRRIGVLVNDADAFAKPYTTQMTEAARSAGLAMEVVVTRPGHPLEPVFDVLTGKPIDGVFVQGTLVRRELFELATKHRLPTVTSNRLGPPIGALMSYGANLPDLARQSATYIDRILKGAKPADLPVAFPTKFDLAINLKVAKALGIEIPPRLLFTANEVIE